MLIASGLTTYVVIERIDYYFDRTRLSRQQMYVVIELEAQMNRYSENIAELLLLGRTELADLEEARSALDAGLNRLARLVDRETVLIEDADQLAQRDKLDRAASMRTVFERIDRLTERLLVLRDAGRTDEAVRVFKDNIEDALDTELEALVADAVAEAAAELAVAEDETDALENRLQRLVIAMTGLAIVVSVTAGIAMAAMLRRPLLDLIRGTRAIGEGNLAYRIRTGRTDEFGTLAAQFNATAGSLERQRDELLQIQAGLEAEVDRRTAELGDANERLQRLDQMRMLFLAEISHELRTPLTVLRGEAEVTLRAERSLAEHRDTLGRIVLLVQQMSRLVDDLLFLARAEVGAVRFDMQLVALDEVLEIALSSARILAAERAIGLDVRSPAGPTVVVGDAERIAQALLIVLDNAVKYADPDSRIEISTTSAGDTVEISVVNEGKPIPAADIPYVFHRFYRVPQRRGEVSGAGLGLPIAKWIVDMHRGTIALAAAGRRVTVVLRFPRAT